MTSMSVMEFMKQWGDKPFTPQDYMRDIVLVPKNPAALPLRRVHASARCRKKATIRVRRKAEVFKNCYPVMIDEVIPLDNKAVMVSVTFQMEVPSQAPLKQPIFTFEADPSWGAFKLPPT